MQMSRDDLEAILYDAIYSYDGSNLVKYTEKIAKKTEADYIACGKI